MQPLSTEEELAFVRPEQESLAATLPLELLELIIQSGETEGAVRERAVLALSAEGKERNQWSVRMMGISLRWREVAQGRGRYNVEGEERLKGLLSLIESSERVDTGMRELSILGLGIDQVAKLLESLVPGLRSLALQNVTRLDTNDWLRVVIAMTRMVQMETFIVRHCDSFPSNGLLALLKSWPRLKKLELESEIVGDFPVLDVVDLPIPSSSTLPPSLVELKVRTSASICPTLEYLAKSTTRSIRRLEVHIYANGFDTDTEERIAASLQVLAADATSVYLAASRADGMEIINALVPALHACTTLEWHAPSQLLPVAAIVALPNLRHLLLHPSEISLSSIVKIITERGRAGLHCVHAIFSRSGNITGNITTSIKAACDEAGVIFSEDVICFHK